MTRSPASAVRRRWRGLARHPIARHLTARRRRTVVIVGAGVLLALAIGVRARPDVLFDDAAITFRYAARLADGAGFTFNDGDATNGASAPLYTLVLALLALLGAAPESAAAALGVVCFAVTVALAGLLAARVAGRWAALAAVLLLPTGTAFQNQALSGMESAFAATLGMAGLLALAHRRTTLAGVLIGLAVVNRLDAAALAVAAVAVVWVLFRTLPRRMVLAGALTAAPWFAFAAWYFGSPVPHSATQKLAGRAGRSTFDPTWVLRAVTGREGVVVFLLACAAPALLLLVPSLRPRDRWASCALLAASAWAALHVAAYSVLDLGAPYPWYPAVVHPVAAVGAGVTLAWLGSAAAAALRHPDTSSVAAADAAQGRRRARVAALVGAVLVLGALAVSRLDAARATVDVLMGGYEPRPSRELDRTRREAGRFLAEEAAPGEVVRTCFGWVAYGAADQTIDEVCPLSTREPVDEPVWFVESPGPGEHLVEPEGARLVARFDSPVVEGVRGTTFVFRRDDGRP